MWTQEKLEKVNDAAGDPHVVAANMRKAIQKYSRDDALVRRVLEMARYGGLSGDDTMTMLAYYALHEREKFRDMCLEQISTSPKTHLVSTLAP